MNEIFSEEIILNYLEGNLNRSDAKALEQSIREHSELREKFFQIQAAFEARVAGIETTMDLELYDFEIIKSNIFETLNIGKGGEGVEKIDVDSTKTFIKPKWNWYTLGSIGIAATLLIALTPFFLKHVGVFGTKVGDGPAIVVYDIADGASTDIMSIRSGENIREVIYVNREHYDGLSRAEAYAEQLWTEYEDQKSKDSASIDGIGFVVYDLIGNQGFVGFYESSGSGTTQGNQSSETLWLAGGETNAEVEVGPVSGEPGIYYFNLDKNNLKVSTLDEFVPITKSESVDGI